MSDRLRILIVDDDPLDREALRRALNRDALRFETIAADLVEVETLAQAREILGREEFSCIFLDYLLPDGSGLELLIEARDRDIHTPIIVLTGQRDDDTMMAMIRAGAVDYMPKSALTPELAARSVRAAVRFQQAQREKQAALAALHIRDDAIAAASNGIVISDASLPDYPMIYVNPAFLAMTGYTEAESLGRNCRFLQGPGTDPAAVAELREAVRTAQPRQTLILNYRKDGTEFWNEITVSPVCSPSGAVTHYIGVQTDVSVRQYNDKARKAAEEQLQETVALLDTLLDSAPVGFAFFDCDLRYRRVNETLARINGIPAEAMLGRTVAEVLPLMADVENNLRSVLETGQAQIGVEVKGQTPASPNRERHWISSYYPVDDAQGHRLGVGVLVMEVTERKAAEEGLRQFQFISEKANDAFYLLDEQGRFVYVNDAARRALGYTAAQMQTMQAVDINAAFSRESFDALFRQAQTETIPPFESEHRRADGTAFPVEASVSSLSVSGRTLLFASVRDITERRRQQEELAALYEREHKIAESLQRSLLNKPPASILTGLDVETLYRPAWDEAQVGGDYFDVFALDGGRLALVVGDVSGKGLAAASRTAEIKYTLRAYLREHSDAASALGRLNAFLCESQAMEADSSDEYFVVMTLTVVDAATGMARIAAAGAEPPILLHADGTFAEVAVSGIPLGIAAKASYQAVDLYLDTGDVLLVATDGVTEARQGRQFLGNDGMARLAAAALPLGPLADIGQAVLDGAKAFAENRLHDDVCLLLARRK